MKSLKTIVDPASAHAHEVTKMKLSDTKIVKKYSPRKRLDEDTIKRYQEAYEIGEDMPPLIVQKEKLILIDGYHRHEALTRLGREEVEIELRDIPEDEIPIESIRCNRKHGRSFTVEETDDLIWYLKTQRGLTHQQIADIMLCSVGTISNKLKKLTELRNFSGKKTTLDKRRKIEDQVKVVSRYKQGDPIGDIARDEGVTSSRISQITKPFRETPKDHVSLVTSSNLFNFFIKASIANNLNERAYIEFTPRGAKVFRYKNNYGVQVTVAGFFNQSYFSFYNVKENSTWEILRDDLKWDSMLKRAYGPVQFDWDGTKFTLKTSKPDIGSWGIERKAIGYQSEMDLFDKIDESGLPVNADVVFDFNLDDLRHHWEAPRMHVGLEDSKITISGTSKLEWTFSKSFPVEVDELLNISSEFNPVLIDSIVKLKVPSGIKYRTVMGFHGRGGLFMNFIGEHFFIAYYIHHI